MRATTPRTSQAREGEGEEKAQRIAAKYRSGVDRIAVAVAPAFDSGITRATSILKADAAM
jgi:hypothetical protein